MNEYRKEMSEIATESRWTFFRFLPLFLGGIAILFMFFFGLRTLGLIGGTVVERGKQ